jgi:hypothetical protein
MFGMAADAFESAPEMGIIEAITSVTRTMAAELHTGKSEARRDRRFKSGGTPGTCAAEYLSVIDLWFQCH